MPVAIVAEGLGKRYRLGETRRCTVRFARPHSARGGSY